MESTSNRPEHFPISFFAMVMGLAGLTIAWEKARHSLGVPLALNTALVTLTAAVFAILLVTYMAKLARYRKAVLEELGHPVKLNFFPTCFILIAPPAVGFVAYVKLTGGLDSFGRVLYFIGLFLTLLLITQAGRFARLQFFLSWWAYSFPVAAITLATMLRYDLSAAGFYRYLGLGLLAVLSLVVVYLLVKTTTAVLRKGICVPEG